MTMEQVRYLVSFLIVAIDGYDSLTRESQVLELERGLLPENPAPEDIEHAEELKQQVEQVEKARSGLFAQISSKVNSFKD